MEQVAKDITILRRFRTERRRDPAMAHRMVSGLTRWFDLAAQGKAFEMMKEQQEQPVQQDLLTAPELAIKLSMSLKFIIKYTQRGLFPGQIKVGGVWRYHYAQVLKRYYSSPKFLLETSIFRRLPPGRPR